MKFKSNQNQLVLCSIILSCMLLSAELSFAQIPNSDIVPRATAIARKESFHTRFHIPNRPITRAITFSVAQLQAVIDQYKAAGDTLITFVPALIRPDDAARYIAKHPNLTTGQIVNKSTLLIKAPPHASASSKRMFFADYYYDLGSICPPPGSCIE